ncbi:MAG: hypothetical protein CL916_11115 [Deltaproteobacteria bacterium]|nr:hypothetical protein [Deltaproteobacteria bacterium]
MPNFSILTWNISQANASHAAPTDWKDADGAENRTVISNLIRSHNPDILALQEIPDPSWLPMIVSFDAYIPLGSAQTHCGFTTLLIRPQLAKNIKNVYQVGPSIIAFWKNKSITLSISSSHLHPGKGGSPERKEQYTALWQCANQQNATHMVFAGDMNMRGHEDANMESICHPPLHDVWKKIGTHQNKWTWNTKINHYHKNRFAFTARFDRIYSTSNIEQKSLRLVGGTPLSNPHHFASDHFGLCAQMMITQ